MTRLGGGNPFPLDPSGLEQERPTRGAASREDADGEGPGVSAPPGVLAPGLLTAAACLILPTRSGGAGGGHLPKPEMQETRAQPLVGDDPTCQGAINPVRHSR